MLPDLKRLGPRLGKQLPALKVALAEADAAALLAQMNAEGSVTLEISGAQVAELRADGEVTYKTVDGPVTLGAQDLQVRLQAKAGWAAAQGADCVVVLSTELTDDWWAKVLPESWSTRFKPSAKTATLNTPTGFRSASPRKTPRFARPSASSPSTSAAKPWRRTSRSAQLPGSEAVEVKLGAATVNLYVKAGAA